MEGLTPYVSYSNEVHGIRCPGLYPKNSGVVETNKKTTPHTGIKT